MFKEIVHAEQPFVVAGPCSAESREQLSCTVRQLMAEPRVSMLRCGVWKPRTRPGGFEGMGEEALRWIADLKRQNVRLPFAVEVASPQHVELALRYGIDVLWIGARTAGNPFSVAELAESLRGTAVPVMVKNPLVPDVKLWMGALERLQQAGLTDLAAVHRGFATHADPSLRNDPHWELPIELRRVMPDMPLLCDPSHLGGRREWLPKLSQRALDMDFDGLMLECHCTPDQAMTDAAQQVSPVQLSQLLDGLHIHTHCRDNSADLLLCRERISAIDEELLALLAARQTVSKEIGEVKRRENLPIYQPRQWQHKLQWCQERAVALGLDPAFVRDVFEMLHLHSIQAQSPADDVIPHPDE